MQGYRNPLLPSPSAIAANEPSIVSTETAIITYEAAVIADRPAVAAKTEIVVIVDLVFDENGARAGSCPDSAAYESAFLAAEQTTYESARRGPASYVCDLFSCGSAVRPAATAMIRACRHSRGKHQ